MLEKPTYEELEQRIRELEQAEGEARQRTEVLQEFERREKALFERSLNPIAIVDREWHYLDANPAFLKFVEKSKEELLCMHTFDFAPLEKKMSQKERHQAVSETGGTVETEYLINGQVKALELTVTPIVHKGIHAVIGVGRDITENRRILMELEESSVVLRTVLDATPNCVFVKDRNGRYLLVNNAITDLYHSARDEMIGNTDMDLARMGRLDHDEALAFMADDQEVMETRRQKQVYREPLTAEDGTISWFYTIKKPISLPQNPHCTLGIATDITKLKEAELALQESEGRIRVKLHALLSPEGDIGALDLADILDTQAVQKIFDDLYRVTNIGGAIVDIKGKVLVATGWQDICTRFHRVHPETGKNCIESDLHLSSGVEPGTFKIYRCKNNMWDAATPIVVAGTHLGNVFFGQFFFEEETPDYEIFREQARRYGFDEAAYLDALGRVPRWSRDTIDAVMNFYARFADLVSTLSYSNLKLARSIEQCEWAETALRKEKERFRQILEGFPYGIYIVDQHYCIEYVNHFLRSRLGEPLDLKCYQYFHGLEEPCPWCQNEKVFAGETVRWNWHSPKDGRDFELVDVPLENDDGTVSKLEVFHDITDRMRAEKALEESERRFRTLIESAPLSIMAVRNGRFVFANPAGIKTLGYETLDEMIGLDALEAVAPEYRNMIRDRIMRVDIGYENPSVEFKILRPDGQKVWFKSSSVVIDFEGTPAVLILGRDITEEKLAEDDRARLMSAIEQAGEIIVITDPEGNIQYVNPAFESVTGYEQKEVIGRTPRILKSGRQDERFYRDLWQTISSGKRWKKQIVNRKKDGSLYTEDASISPVMNKDGSIIHFVAVKRDVTSEIDMEKRLSQAQKMEAIGNLAGGIAHDFNNILSPIMLHAEMAMMNLPPDSPLQMKLDQIFKSSERARDLVQQILTFARVQGTEKIPLRVSLIVKEAVKFLRASIPTTIDLSYELTTDRDTVLADPTQMHQIVMNLCTNAAYAMRDTGGQLKMSLSNTYVGQEEAGRHDVSPGDFLELSVSDTGTGIAPDIIDNIFEPYFTTKELGQGTGLGLAVTHGIVESCEGYIIVDSEAGRGSVFRVYLPVVDAHVSAFQEETVAPTGGTERILLVDDEPAAIRALQPLLERLGYQVTARTDSLEAVDLFREAPGAFDVVITDQTMPHMTGKELAIELMSIRPDVPIIICTGYSEQIDATVARDMGIKGFAPKPINMRQMARAIREAVE